MDRNRSTRQKRTGTPAVPTFSDEPPQSSTLTDYDREHLSLYVRLLDAAEEGAEWTEVARILFGLDPKRDRERARSVYDSHLARAHWMTEHGYRDLLRLALH
jgi:Uncharacterized conserved protein (DUF2285)